MVDLLVVDVKLDMGELTSIGLSAIGTLAGLSYRHDLGFGLRG